MKREEALVMASEVLAGKSRSYVSDASHLAKYVVSSVEREEALESADSARIDWFEAQDQRLENIFAACVRAASKISVRALIDAAMAEDP